MKNTKHTKPLAIILVIALAVSLMPIRAYSANETHATFVQDALRSSTMDNGSSVTGSLMTGLYEYPIGGNVVNCVGKTDYYSSPGAYEQYDSALKFTLPATNATLVGATLRLKVVHREGSPTATVTMTNDNNWQQTDGADSTFPYYSAPLELASGEPITAENAWQDIGLTNLAALAAKIGSSANDVTLIITGSTISGYYFDFLADDDPSPEAGAELILEFAPFVSSVAAPSSGTYKAGDSLIYTVSFSDDVIVTGTPYLTLTVGSSSVHANYLYGSGTSQLVFGYTVGSGDKDTDGVALSSNVSLGGGTIRDAAGNNATLAFTGSNAAGVRVKATQTITFANPGAQNFGTSPTLTATSDSTLPVTFTSDTPDVCTITSEGVLTFLKAGAATISANQSGNSEYMPATTVSRSFTVNAVAPGAPIIGTATAGNGQASLSFTPPAFTGGADITGYTVTSSPGGFTGTGTGSPITVAGLTNGVAYTFTVTATNSAGTGTASAASNSVTPKAPQTITFANPGAQNFGTHPTLTATSDSTLPVTFTSDTPDVCTTTSEGVLTFLKAGTATISADQAGNDSYLAAVTVSRSFTVNAVVPGAPTIGTATGGDTQASVSFTPPAFTGGADITGYIVTSSPEDITVMGASSPIVLTGLTNGASYTFTVAAMNSAGTGPASAASNSVMPKAQQTITFANPGAQNFGTHPMLTATSDSTLPVTFTSDTPDVCTITSGGVLTFLKAGTATISADQAGNGSYLAAATVSRSFTVNAVVPGAPTIGTATAGNGQVSLSFTPPAFTGGADITGYTVTSNPGSFTGTGTGSPITVAGLTNGVAYTFTVTATNSAGTGAASAASDSVTPKTPQTITFAGPGTQNFGTHPTLTATSSSGLPVTFTSDTPDVCTVTSGGVLTFLKAGAATISAHQSGNGEYLPATVVSQSFTVSAVVPGAPTISAATAGNGQASISFTHPAFTGGADITGYTVTSSPGGFTGTETGSPITVAGLMNGAVYTFTVTATNSAGTGAASAASNSVMPIAAATPTPAPVPSATPTPTPAPSTTPRATATPAPSTTPRATATPTPSATPSATPTPAPITSATPEPAAPPDPSATASPSATPAADTRTITGTLVDADGNPMSGYVVELHSDPMTTTTDADGRYTFHDVDYTSHELIVKTPAGEKIAEFALEFSEGKEFGTNMTKAGADITYTRSTETVSIEVVVTPDQGGAKISQVSGSDKTPSDDPGGFGSVLWWIAGGVLAAIIAVLLIVALQKKKRKADRTELN